jgi:cyclophilin family peptidyl-prolyl cis-trans isomerase
LLQILHPAGELMLARVSFATLILFSLVASASAQVVRFETTVGSFDMVLNPTNNARLQGHVDNMLDYVNNNSYNSSWINRADTGFVLQMGGFHSHTKRPPMTIASTRPVDSFTPVQGEPGITGLSNTVGTVALALPGGAGGTNQDGGSSSFFVNLTSNTFLDADFTVFAAISDMTVVNQIMGLTTVDRTTDPVFGAGSGNLAFSDVPVTANGFQVFIKRAFVISDTMSVARAMAGVRSAVNASQLAATGSGGSSNAAFASFSVPEPSAFALVITALSFLKPRRRRS